MNPDPRIPVIVVGGGLSGIATALGLALKGREAIVLESSDYSAALRRIPAE
jgi:2-polyprenyl-6-methoxyphenol hydroxylase-like FAD-dependent oxidoreductase